MITGIILCGGPGARIDGADKPLLRWRDATLIEHLAGRLSSQVEAIVISANRNAATYARYGQVVGDELRNYQGPLSGIAACLPHCAGEFAFVCPGDAPLLPVDLVERLQRGLGQGAVAVAHDGHRRQNLHMLLRTSLINELTRYLQSGGRSVHGWLRGVDAADVDCSQYADAFRKFNAPEDFIDSGGNST